MTAVTYRRNKVQIIGLILGPILFLATSLLDLDPDIPLVGRMAAVSVLMAVWWVTEAIPLAATSLMPVVLFPLLGIMTPAATAPLYFNSTIFLFMGGFIIALAMERWNLHKRIALLVIKTIGGSPSRLVLGFMVAAAFLSMWISNTATAVMMLPVGLSIILKMEEEFGKSSAHKFSVALMLGIAYSASIGGMATLVGTPPNLVFQRVFGLTFPEAPGIPFGSWFIMALPIAAVMLVITWLMLTKALYRPAADLKIDRRMISREYKDLGPVSPEERIVLAVFAITALLWLFRTDISLGFVDIPGWSRLLPDAVTLDDGTVAMIMALLLFFIPTRSEAASARSATLVDTTVFPRLPWGVIILFGGGFALAKGFQVSGLAGYLGGQLVDLARFSPVVMVRADLEHRDHPDDPAGSQFAGRGHRRESHAADDPGHAVGVVCVHDAGGDPAQRHRLRQRAREDLGDGQGGCGAQRHRHRPGDRRGVPVGLGGVRLRTGRAAGLGQPGARCQAAGRRRRAR